MTQVRWVEPDSMYHGQLGLLVDRSVDEVDGLIWVHFDDTRYAPRVFARDKCSVLSLREPRIGDCLVARANVYQHTEVRDEQLLVVTNPPQAGMMGVTGTFCLDALVSCHYYLVVEPVTQAPVQEPSRSRFSHILGGVISCPV